MRKFILEYVDAKLRNSSTWRYELMDFNMSAFRNTITEEFSDMVAAVDRIFEIGGSLDWGFKLFNIIDTSLEREGFYNPSQLSGAWYSCFGDENVQFELDSLILSEEGYEIIKNLLKRDELFYTFFIHPKGAESPYTLEEFQKKFVVDDFKDIDLFYSPSEKKFTSLRELYWNDEGESIEYTPDYIESWRD